MAVTITYDESGYPDGSVTLSDAPPGSPQPIVAWSPNDVLFPVAAPAAAAQRGGHPLVAFQDAVVQQVQASGVAPLEYAGGSLVAHIDWCAEPPLVAGDVVWGVSLEVDAGATNVDVENFGAETLSAPTTAPATNGRFATTPITIAGAALGGIAAGVPFRLRLRRAGTDPADTLAGRAQVLDVWLSFAP